MKKRLMLLALTGFLLSGCGEPSNNEPINPPDENEDNDDKPDNPDIDPGDEEEVINPDITPFTKISELTKYINETVPALEQKNGVTFEREFIYSYEDIYATITREIKETGTSYSNDTLVIKGERTLSRDYPEDDYLEDEKETDTYDSITSLKDGVYYSVVDYKESNDNDDSYKEDYNAENESKYKENTSLSTYKNLSSYLDDYVKGKYVTNGASDKVTSTVDTTSGNFVTTFTMTDETENEYGKYLTEASFTVNFLKDGNFAGFDAAAVSATEPCGRSCPAISPGAPSTDIRRRKSRPIPHRDLRARTAQSNREHRGSAAERQLHTAQSGDRQAGYCQAAAGLCRWSGLPQ